MVDLAVEVLDVHVADGDAGFRRRLQLVVEGEELGVQDCHAPRLPLDRAGHVHERRSDAARDRLDSKRETGALGDVRAGWQEREVALEVAVAERQLPQVQDQEPGADTSGQPCAALEPVDGARVALAQPGAYRLLGVRGRDRKA